jgi:hypothetical protein
MNGYPINWALPASERFKTHPLYIKYNSQTFAMIDASIVKADLGQVVANGESAMICAYLSWILRTKELISP